MNTPDHEQEQEAVRQREWNLPQTLETSLNRASIKLLEAFPDQYFQLIFRDGGCLDIPPDAGQRIVQAHDGVGRFYHTSQHLIDCLHQLETHRQHFSEANIPLVAMALCFHDIVYEARLSNNEERSAQVVVEAFEVMNGPAWFAAQVAEIILVTKDHVLKPDAPNALETSIVLDIDLSILGRTADEFWEYEEKIRMEYEWVPLLVYAEKRAAVLQKFLERTFIYLTAPFREQYEAQARENLRASIAKLRDTAERILVRGEAAT